VDAGGFEPIIPRRSHIKCIKNIHLINILGINTNMKDIITLNNFVKNQAKQIEQQGKQIVALKEAINILNRRLVTTDKKRATLTEKVRRQENDINTVKSKLKG